MSTPDLLNRLLERNRTWVEATTRDDPTFFTRREGTQAPDFLFVGCSDSRVPAELLTQAHPGELFVHRNIANQVVPSDLNLLSVLQYAVEALKVEHILVCGHYGCGGVRAAVDGTTYGLVDHWLNSIRNVARWHRAELDAQPDAVARERRLVELNVVEQLLTLSQLPVVQQTWERHTRGAGPPLLLHGLVYDLGRGLLKPVVTAVGSEESAAALLPKHAGTPPRQVADGTPDVGTGGATPAPLVVAPIGLPA